MSALRCPHCDSVLTPAEADAGTCPECAAPLTEAPFAEPVAVAELIPERSGSRFGFLAGLAVGVLLAAGGAGAAWYAWGRPAFDQQVAEMPNILDPAAAEEARQAVATARQAREAAAEAEIQREATETALTTVRSRVQQALGQLAAAEKQLATAETRQQSAQDRAAALERANGEAAARPKALQAKGPDPRQAEAQRAAVERATAEARTRLQAIQVQQAAADRALADARDRALAAQNQFAEADRQLTTTRARLQTVRDQAAALDRELADKKAKVADQDRALAAKRNQLTDLDRAVQAKRPRPVEPPPLPAPKATAGFVRDWLVVGPFPAPDRKGHATRFPAEFGSANPKEDFQIGGKTLHWRAHSSSADYVDLGGRFQTEDPAVGYAACWVRSDRARRVQLFLGSNHGMKVWVNGKVVASQPTSRAAAPGQDRATCDLVVGWNEVRVKVDNTGGPWGFYFEVRNSTGERPATDLQFRTTPPSR